jgi:hypothetical protein
VPVYDVRCAVCEHDLDARDQVGRGWAGR